MAEPNYAYNPAVASWVQSMSLAGIEEQDLDLDLDEQPHQSHHNHPNHHQYSHTHNHHNNHHQDDAPDSPSPDDYYKSAYTPAPEHDFAAPPADMNVTRQRQNTAGSNSVRSPIRGGPRSVSGPASSIASSRSPPQASNKVKALAERFLGRGETATAEKWAEECLHIDVYDPTAHSLLADARAAGKKYAGAIEEYQTALELKVKRPNDLKVKLARAQFGLGKRDAAKAIVDEILKADPGHPEAKALGEQIASGKS